MSAKPRYPLYLPVAVLLWFMALSPVLAGDLVGWQSVDNQSIYGPSQSWPSTGVNSEVADDFDTIADIDRVVASGYIDGFAPQWRGVYIRFYEYRGDGTPGALQREYFLAAGDANLSVDNSGLVDAHLSPPFAATGRHFLAVQPEVNSWYWWSADTGAPRGQAFYFRNLAAGQTDWRHGDAQFNNPNADVGFALYGSVTGPGTIGSLSAATLPRSGYLEILGSNLGGSGTVRIGGFPAAVALWTGTRIVAYVPEAAPLGGVGVQVLTAGGVSNTLPLSVTARQADGRVSWRLRLEGAYSSVRPARGPDGTIYVLDVGFRLYAVRPDGALMWVRRGAGNKGLAVGADGTIYAASESDVKAFNPDGSLKWTFVQNPRAFIMLGLSVGPDGNIYGVGTEGPGVFSLTPAGVLRWTNPELYQRLIVDYGEIVFGPNTASGQLYFYANNHTRAVRLDNGGSVFTLSPTGQPVVSPLDATMHAKAGAYSPNGQLLWSFAFPIGGLPVSDPDVAFDGTHYVVNRTTDLYSLNPHGGENWHVSLPNAVGAPNIDPANSVVVLGSNNTLDHPGFIQGIGVASRREVWRVDLPKEEPAVFNTSTGQLGFNQFVETRALFSADSSAVYLITAIATGGLVQDRSFLYSIVTDASASTTPSPRLRCTGIVLSTRERRGVVLVSGTVKIEDENALPVPGAAVSVTWTKPTGAIVSQTALTDTTGIAKVSITSVRGTYTLTLTSISKTGYIFDAASSVLTQTISKK